MSSFQPKTPKQVTTLSPQEQEHLNQVINEVLTEYDIQADKQTVEEFTLDFVKKKR